MNISNTMPNHESCTLPDAVSKLMQHLKATGRIILKVGNGFFRAIFAPCEIQEQVDSARIAAMARLHL